jgi:hypothetical protein
MCDSVGASARLCASDDASRAGQQTDQLLLQDGVLLLLPLQLRLQPRVHRRLLPAVKLAAAGRHAIHIRNDVAGVRLLLLLLPLLVVVLVMELRRKCTLGSNRHALLVCVIQDPQQELPHMQRQSSGG